MLQIPEDLTKSLNGSDLDSKALLFAKSARPLLGIAAAIFKRNCAPRDPLLSDEILEDLLLCCAAFASGDGEYGGTSMWTSKDLHELSMTLLTYLSDVAHPNDGPNMVNSDGLKTEAGPKLLKSGYTNFTTLILGQVSSLMPRLKQIIQESSGSLSNDEILLKSSSEGSLGSSIVAAYQMRWVLGQVRTFNKLSWPSMSFSSFKEVASEE
jgi:hypothetical protein